MTAIKNILKKNDDEMIFEEMHNYLEKIKYLNIGNITKNMDDFIKQIPNHLFYNKYFIEDAIKYIPQMLSYIPKKLLEDDSIIGVNLLKHIYVEDVLVYLPKESFNKLRNDYSFVSKMIQIDGGYFKYASDELKKSKELLFQALKNVIEPNDHILLIDMISQNSLENTNMILNFLNNNDILYKIKKHELLENIKLDADVIYERYYSLNVNLQKELFKHIVEKVDKNIFMYHLKNVENNAYAKYNHDFKNDIDVIKLAVSVSEKNYEILPDSLKENKDLILSALNNKKNIWDSIPQKMQKDKEIVLKAIEGKFIKLDMIDENNRNDILVIYAYISNNAIRDNDLRLINKKIINNKVIANILINSNSYAYQLFNEELQNNEQILLSFLKNNRNHYALIPENKKNDKVFNLLLMQNKIYPDVSLLPKDIIWDLKIAECLIGQDCSNISLYLKKNMKIKNLTKDQKKFLFELKEVVEKNKEEIIDFYNIYVKIYQQIREERLLIQLNEVENKIEKRKQQKI